VRSAIHQDVDTILAYSFKHFELTAAQIVSCGAVIRLRAEQRRKFRSIPDWDKQIYLFSIRSRKTLGSTLALTQWVLGAFPPG